MGTIDEAKRIAARAALDELPHEGVIGLGSGSTAKLFIEGVGELVRAGRKLVGVPTSEGSRQQALALGIPLLPDDGPWQLDVCVDGADEADPTLDLIKGGGAAHTREKIVNHASRRNVIIVDASKLSPRLGTKWPVPIEVLPFAHLTTRDHLARFGTPLLRARDGAAVCTDAGNLIYDLRTGPIENAAVLDRALHAVPGVVESGLFIGRCDLLIVAEPDGSVRRLTRP
jgi:ribose 5-phosphate isomerase A